MALSEQLGSLREKGEELHRQIPKLREEREELNRQILQETEDKAKFENEWGSGPDFSILEDRRKHLRELQEGADPTAKSSYQKELSELHEIFMAALELQSSLWCKTRAKEDLDKKIQRTNAKKEMYELNDLEEDDNL